MPIYKAPDNSIHVIEARFAYMLPVGCVQITDAEAEAIRIANIPAPTKEQLTAEIEKQRDAALASGFAYGGAQYHCDPIFQSQLQAFILAWQSGLLAPTATVAIRRKDNVTVQMTQADVIALAGALMQHVQGIYAASWAAKDALP